METFKALIIILFLSSQIHGQENPFNQTQAFKTNKIIEVKKILIQTSNQSKKVDSILISIRKINKQGLHTEEILYDTSDLVISEYSAKYLSDSLIIESKTSKPDLKIIFEYNDKNQIKNEKSFLSGKMSATKIYYYKNDTLDKTEKFYLKSKNSSSSFERNSFIYDLKNDITTIKEEKSTHKKNELSVSTVVIRWSQDKRTQSFWVTDKISPNWFMTERLINYKEELKDTQEQFYRTNAFINQAGLKISISRGDKLLTENLYDTNGLLKETKIFRNNDLLATYLYKYLRQE